MSDWQPIETAPKDETVVLLFIPDFGGGDDNPCMITGFHDGYDGPHRIGAGWTSNDMARVATGGSPTHWMPLPQPPTA